MKKRIGYIGISTPIAYDTELKPSTDKSVISSIEHPILEGAFGLLLFYDELWFLSRELCPLNMRDLPYVKFLNEMYDDIDYSSLVYTYDSFPQYDVNQLRQKTTRIGNMLDFMEQRSITSVTDSAINASSYFYLDNNNQTIIKGHPYDPANIIFDLNMITYLREVKGVDLEMIANTFSEHMFKFEINELQQQSPPLFELATKLTLETANYLKKDGPYHPSLEDIRNLNTLIDFRKWLMEEHGKITQAEIDEVSIEVQQKLERLKEQAFSRFYDQNTYYLAIGKTFIFTLVAHIKPELGPAIALGEIISSLTNAEHTKKEQYANFLITAHKKLRKK